MLLDIRNLTIDFESRARTTRAVNDVSLSIDAKQSIGLVGESGSGKTSLGLAVTRLLPEPPARIVSGEALWHPANKPFLTGGSKGAVDLLQLPREQLGSVRGGQIAYVFQEPSTSLNPVMTVGRQLIETLELHTPWKEEAARRQAVDLLKRVGIPAAAERLGSYPHELSGGMKQRVMIAMAIASSPELLIADEPTTALDVTLERQIVALLKDLQRDLGLSLLVISHNIHLVKQLADRIVVMWQGKIVEDGPVDRVLSSPKHAYTKRLLAAQPRVPALDG